MKYELKVKRSYAPESTEDGARILVDRLWPRGESKAKADLLEWNKDIAPEKSLREAFHQGKLSYEEFKKQYLNQLENSEKAREFLHHILNLLQNSNVTLLFSSKNESENNAVVLQEWLIKNMEH